MPLKGEKAVSKLNVPTFKTYIRALNRARQLSRTNPTHKFRVLPYAERWVVAIDYDPASAETPVYCD
jgi:hypothetical protein